MIKFLNLSKQNITVLSGITIHMNAHFITDTSQSWIFSNTKAEEGVCEAYIHYISGENNKQMMMEQPLWRGYLEQEALQEGAREQLLEHIQQPIIHVVLNIHNKYKHMTSDILSFVNGLLKKNHHEIEEIVIDAFVYTEVVEFEGDNI